MQRATMQFTPTEHVYYVTWRRRYRWILLCYSVIGAISVITGILIRSWGNIIVGIYFFVLIPLISKSWRSNYLVITPGGIAYHINGAVLNVPWHEMAYIGTSTQRWYRGWEGIILQKAEWQPSRWFPWPNRWRPQFIPLWSRWNGPWWDRELFDDIFFFAPWLADNGSGPRSDHP